MGVKQWCTGLTFDFIMCKGEQRSEFEPTLCTCRIYISWVVKKICRYFSVFLTISVIPPLTISLSHVTEK